MLSRYARFEALFGVRECLAGVAVRRFEMRLLLGVTWESSSLETEDGLRREPVLEGVLFADGGESRSNRPRTSPFFWGVGPTKVRFARGVACKGGS